MTEPRTVNEPAGEARPTWQTDDPLFDPNDDRLGRAAFARGVADAIATRRDEASIVLGLFGPWGDGKTTVLNFVERGLAEYEDIVVVRFNPWLIADERNLLPAFFAQVAADLDRRLGGTRRMIAEGLRKFGTALGAISLPLGSASLGGAGTGAVAEALAGSTLDDLRRDFELLLRGEGKRVVVVIDDLDRLDDREIRAMFRLVRLAAPFDRVTYLVACDDSVVATALRDMHGGTEQTGHAYLEKIIQVPLHIPPASETALIRIAFEGIETLLEDLGITLSPETAQEIGAGYRTGLSPAIRTPRSVKRLLNALTFALPLLKGEANVADVIAVEGIHVAYPVLYRALREHPAWFLARTPTVRLGRADDQDGQAARQRIEGVLAPLGPGQRDAAIALLRSLYPLVDSMWSDSFETRSEAELFAGQRMASPAYYDRYLSYALPTDEVSDQELDALLADPSTLAEGIAGRIAAEGPAIVGSLTTKLTTRLDGLSAEAQLVLLELLPRLGPTVLDTREVPSVLFGYSLQEQLARLIAGLVVQLPPRARIKAARRVAAEAVPLTFAIECVRKMRARRDEDRQRTLSDTDLTGLQRALGQRVLAEALPDVPLWTIEPRWQALLFVAAEGPGARRVRGLVRAWLATGSDAIDVLLTGLAGKMVGSSGVKQDDFTTATYDDLKAIAHLRDVRRAVRSKYGSLKVETYPPDASYAADPVRAVVEQFVFVDRSAQHRPRSAKSSDKAGEAAHPSEG